MFGFYDISKVVSAYDKELFEQVKSNCEKLNLEIEETAMSLKSELNADSSLYFKLKDTNKIKDVWVDRGFNLSTQTFNFNNCVLSGNFKGKANVSNSIIRCGGRNIDNTVIEDSYIVGSSLKDSIINQSLVENSKLESRRVIEEIEVDSKETLNKHGIITMNLCGFQSIPNVDLFDKIFKRVFSGSFLCYQECKTRNESMAYSYKDKIKFVNRDRQIVAAVKQGNYTFGVLNIHAKAFDTNSTRYISKCLTENFIDKQVNKYDYFIIIGDFNGNVPIYKLAHHKNHIRVKKSSKVKYDDCLVFSKNSKFKFNYEILQIPTIDNKNHKLGILSMSR